MTTLTTTPFFFNGDFQDLAQVAPFLPAFEARLAELEAAGEYRYNDAFKGCIPGIMNIHNNASMPMTSRITLNCGVNISVRHPPSSGGGPSCG